MGIFIKRRRLHICWIACFAILLNALAPSMAHAFSRNSPTNLFEVCSASGAKVTLGDQGAASKSPSGSVVHHMEHCPFCMNHAGTFALPSVMVPQFAVAGAQRQFPSLFYHSPTPLFSWSRANPRAPPALS
jgi:hypothetical protein